MNIVYDEQKINIVIITDYQLFLIIFYFFKAF